jgi:hypothetical protein
MCLCYVRPGLAPNEACVRLLESFFQKERSLYRGTDVFVPLLQMAVRNYSPLGTECVQI